MPWVSSEVMSVHLAEIGKAVDPNAHCVLICDGAGWHQSGERLTVPHNVTLLRLPPYAPELNPIENVWEYLRGNYLSHTVWGTYEQIVEACCTAWNAFINNIERVTSVTTRQWARVTSKARWYKSALLSRTDIGNGGCDLRLVPKANANLSGAGSANGLAGRMELFSKSGGSAKTLPTTHGYPSIPELRF